MPLIISEINAQSGWCQIIFDDGGELHLDAYTASKIQAAVHGGEGASYSFKNHGAAPCVTCGPSTAEGKEITAIACESNFLRLHARDEFIKLNRATVEEVINAVELNGKTSFQMQTQCGVTVTGSLSTLTFELHSLRISASKEFFLDHAKHFMEPALND
jgi:hypothetical protein